MITTQFRTRYILTLRLICICVYLVCLRPEQLFCEKRKQHASPGDNVSTAKAASGRVGRGEQGEARRTNSTPNGEPRFELARLRLKTWCKNDLSIAHTTPHSSYMYLYVHPHSLVQRATFCIAPTSRCSMAQSQAETLHNQLLFIAKANEIQVMNPSDVRIILAHTKISAINVMARVKEQLVV